MGVSAISSELRRRLYQELPSYARSLVESERYRNKTDPYRKNYAEFPDDPRMHSPQWHQWGVISHTLKVGQQFEQSIPIQLGTWFGPRAASNRLGLLDEKIGNETKWDLLLASVPTHDWGKFTVRGLARGSGKDPKFRFGGHESESGELVRLRASWFRDGALSPDQIEYIARCSELHFELGKVRDQARNQGGYSLAWVSSEQFLAAAQRVITRCPGFEREVGLFFLADNWAKTDLIDNSEFATDSDLSALRDTIKRRIKTRGLEPTLINCALQVPINTAIGKRYLEQVLSNDRSHRP